MHVILWMIWPQIVASIFLPAAIQAPAPVAARTDPNRQKIDLPSLA